MTIGAAEQTPRRAGALRGLVPRTIYLTTGGVLLSVPAAGGFIVASTIISTVMLSSPFADLADDEVGPAQVTLIAFAVLIGVTTLVLCFFLGGLHRSRAGALLGAEIPKPARQQRGWKRILRLGFTPYALRIVLYYWLGLLWGPLMIAMVLVCLFGFFVVVGFGFNLAATDIPIVDVLIPLIGAVLAVSTPWILKALASADLAMVRWVNGVSEKAALAQRVQQVTEAREGMVAAADAERRRIERNLHDGAQQRLTALAVHLGIERSRYRQMAKTGEPADAQQAQQVLHSAQTEVQTALHEIRHLVRGLHPAVLEDRGLDAAISGIASRAPFPVAVTVEVAKRPSIEVEAVAYFVVSEAMNNIIAHSKAQHASVTVSRSGERLEITIDDDGVGGADEAKGSGLTGLRQRVSSVDGTLQWTSHDDQGTHIRVELPCA